VRYYRGAEVPANLIVTGQEYTVNADSSLTVMKNVPYLSPLTIICVASFFDGRSGQVYHFSTSVVLSSTSAITNPVTLELDRPGGWEFDPLTEDGLRAINATLRLAGSAITDDARRRFWWYVVTGAGTERPIDPEDDLFYEGGQGTPTLMIDPRYVNGELWLRCRAEYIAPGAAAPQAPTASAPFADSTLSRRYSSYSPDMMVHGSELISGTAREVRAEGWVNNRYGIIPDFDKKLRCEWSIKRMVAGAEELVIGYGKEVDIMRSDYENSAELFFDAAPRESLKAAAHGDTVYMIGNEIVTI
jgi:hypothetical protein